MSFHGDPSGSADIDAFRDLPTMTEDALRYVVGVAARAPSIHNSQPWRFVGHSHDVELYVDQARQLSVVDPAGRQLHISAGCALHHLVLALHGIGRRVEVQLLPQSTNPDLLARVTSEPGAEHPTLDDWTLLLATDERHTHRAPFGADRLPMSLLVEMLAVAEAHGVGTRLVQVPGERRALAQLVAEATRQQESDPEYRREIALWTGRPDDAQEGVPGSAAAPLRHDEFRQRDFALGGGRLAWSPATDPERPDIVLLWTAGDTTRDWLRSGDALSALLLAGTRAGVGASPLNQPLELPVLRQSVRRELQLPGNPQFLLRLGFNVTERATRRRPVEQILDIDLSDTR